MNSARAIKSIAVVIVVILGILMAKNILDPSPTASVVSNGPDQNPAAAQDIALSIDSRGTYVPETITVKSGSQVRLVGDMQRLVGCFSSVTIPELGIAKRLSSLDNTLEFTAPSPGAYRMTCSMGMAKGTLVVT